MVELKSFDRVADVYDETRSLPADAERAIADAIFGEVTSIVEHARLIEIGVGTGRIAVPLAARGLRIIGTDISPKMLARLGAKRSDIDIVMAEASSPPLRAGFDAALFVHVLHLVPDVEATLRATLPLVRAGGMIISGRDDEQMGVREEADRAVQRAVREVAGVEISGWKPYRESDEIAERILREAGATVATRSVARWTGRTSAERHLGRLARRDFSSAWQIPDEAIARVVEHVRPELVRLYGSLDGEVEYPRSFSLTVARLPAAPSSG